MLVIVIMGFTIVVLSKPSECDFVTVSCYVFGLSRIESVFWHPLVVMILKCNQDIKFCYKEYELTQQI